MTVYLESNFVLELALGQEQSRAAEAVLEQAERSLARLAVPVLSLSEPFAAVRRRANDTQRLGNELRRQLNELGRSSPHLEDVQDLRTVTARLESIERRELVSLTATVRRVLRVSQIIPVDAVTYGEALSISDRYGLAHHDAIVYASVRGHLGTNEEVGPHYFVNRDKDFNVPGIRGELNLANCELITSFEDIALRLEQAANG